MSSIIENPIIVVWNNFRESMATLLFKDKNWFLIFENKIDKKTSFIFTLLIKILQKHILNYELLLINDKLKNILQEKKWNYK